MTDPILTIAAEISLQYTRKPLPQWLRDEIERGHIEATDEPRWGNAEPCPFWKEPSE